MIQSGGSIVNENREDMLFTYSEEEKQNNEIRKSHSEAIFSPEFIPYYLEEVKAFKLSPTAGLVYGFIRFYKSNNTRRFYFTNSQLAEIFNCSEGTIKNVMSELTSIGLIKTSRKVKNGGGTLRFVNKVLTIKDINPEVIKQGLSEVTKKGLLRSSNNDLHIKENKNKDNNTTKKNNIYNTLVSEKTENKVDIKEEKNNSIDFSNALLTQFNVVYEKLNTKNSTYKCFCICEYIDKICALVNTQPIYNSRTINKFGYLMYGVGLIAEEVVDYVEENSKFVFENVLDMIDSVDGFSDFM